MEVVVAAAGAAAAAGVAVWKVARCEDENPGKVHGACGWSD